ncbi:MULTISPECIES: DUF397 domain-containing protein [Streptomyces]|uniref:DUF397 domain-containing protein n=2 Tax=Streptomyces rimosus subsp. rimosus TaxID=132474 RepID=L8EGG7_STRR1|nr:MULTISPECIES: DUF397 domain-containing protein [Streptomyces]KOG80078.1 hypothetical protein ADK78_05350 [Kitasatospora aureofaciens]MYT46088.1 DUF397 domain-containing protein [Streptomyces sp. SID5471]KEF08351.1 hypothetical protein DF17_04405 [Streptomyces rimosus]KEF20640.1 hypothetical protein DF18_09390 [Streptomyces rimosus]KOT32118.1 hypothetical protein ADK84_28630 [Streptomyces sp. NRRL WC-3701]
MSVPSGHARPRTVRPGLRWRRSSRSTGMNNCVETARIGPGLLAVRDSKNTAGPALLFTSAAWTSFVGGLADHRFTKVG